MGFFIDEDFQYFLDEFGQPHNRSLVEYDVVKKFEGRLPRRLLEYWQEYGFCGFKDGLFWIVNPDNYQESMTTWLKGTGVLELDTFHVFARTGFGSLYLWGEKTGQSWRIDIRDAQIFHKKNYEKDIENGKSSDLIMAFFAITDSYTVDLEDTKTEKSIFEQAVKKYGPLAEDEMFTFEPALFLGGEQTLKTVNKVNFFIQSDILASMGQREIMDIKGLTKKAFDR
jgi:hypothetical protein